MSRIQLTLLVLSLGAAMVAAPVAAQGQEPPPATDTGVATTTAAEAQGGDFDIEENLEDILQEPVGGDAYRYDSQGRRDPFRSLIGPARNTSVGERPPGVAGFLVDEVDLAGVVRTKQSLVAMIAGPDNKGYLLRVGDKIFDGEVVRITQSSIVFRQEVNDPTRIERFREVVKELSPQSVKK